MKCISNTYANAHLIPILNYFSKCSYFSVPEGFPYYHDTIQKAYNESPWDSEYKYLLLKGHKYPHDVVDVTVTVLFTPEMYFGALLKNKDVVTQMIAAYLIRVRTKTFIEVFT